MAPPARAASVGRRRLEGNDDLPSTARCQARSMGGVPAAKAAFEGIAAGSSSTRRRDDLAVRARRYICRLGSDVAGKAGGVHGRCRRQLKRTGAETHPRRVMLGSGVEHTVDVEKPPRTCERLDLGGSRLTLPLGERRHARPPVRCLVGALSLPEAMPDRDLRLVAAFAVNWSPCWSGARRRDGSSA
jgi:hypothetical protein